MTDKGISSLYLFILFIVWIKEFDENMLFIYFFGLRNLAKDIYVYMFYDGLICAEDERVFLKLDQ